MGLINWMFDLYQHHQIDKLRDEAVRARADAAALRGRSGTVDTERLEAAIGELALSVKTLQRALVDKGICTPGEFRELLRRVDGEDGRLDGRSPVP